MRLALREVFRAFRRSPALGMLSITTMAFSLFAFGLFGLVALNIRSALRAIEDRVEVRAFLIDNTTEQQVQELMVAMQRMPQVSDVGYVSPDSALERARAELDEFRDVMEGAMLPASLELRIRPEMRSPEAIQQVSGRLQTYPVVEEVRYGREWVEKLYRIRTIAGVAGTGLGLVFAMVAVIIIGATIRMAILARTREIEIMRLVGATNGFVRLPYLIDGTLKGVIGGLLALLLAWLAHRAINQSLMETQFFSTNQMALGVAAGGIIGLLGSWLSVGRQLRRVWADQ